MSPMFRSLSNRNYRLWVGGSLVSNIGTWMQRVAQDWLVLTVLTTNSGTAVGFTTGLQFLPILILGPYAGVLADRFRKRLILIWTQTAMALCGLIVGLLVVAGAAQLWHIYAAALGLGIASAIDGPTRQAYVSELVDREDVANAVSLNSASFNTARLTGPALAGVLIAWIGSGPVFLLSAASFAAVLLSLWRIRPNECAPFSPTFRRRRQISEGLNYVRQRPDLVLILWMVGFIGAFGMNFPITNALMSTAEFRVGPGEFGLLGSLMAVGTLGGALLAARRSGPRLLHLIGGAVALGLCSFVACLTPTFWLYAAMMIPVGLASITFVNSCNTSIQLSTDGEFRGRVLAFYLAISQGGTALGAPLMGWIGTEFGARWSIGIGGAVVMITGVVALIVVSGRSPLPFKSQVVNALSLRRATR
ncbi:MFS transporter [Arthrobacter sp. NA-172]|uniref:MFS transporter n=1 Tax=Arthrobacter sp. NA-172 TaxID=3367524 RepID=UPI0037553130